MNRLARKAGGSAAPQGFTLLELAIAMSILMVGIVAVVSATSRMHALRGLNRERTLAHNALRSVSERMHARSRAILEAGAPWVPSLLETYGPGGALNGRFDVEGLTAPPGAPSVGSIQILTDETLTDEAVGANLGLPRDLNGDGDAADADVTPDARILPVILTLSWTGRSGTLSLRHSFYLMGY